MEKDFQCFDSHVEADDASWNYYRSLSTGERLRIALELMEPIYEAAEGLQRVYRT